MGPQKTTIMRSVYKTNDCFVAWVALLSFLIAAESMEHDDSIFCNLFRSQSCTFWRFSPYSPEASRFTPTNGLKRINLRNAKTASEGAPASWRAKQASQASAEPKTLETIGAFASGQRRSIAPATNMAPGDFGRFHLPYYRHP